MHRRTGIPAGLRRTLGSAGRGGTRCWCAPCWEWRWRTLPARMKSPAAAKAPPNSLRSTRTQPAQWSNLPSCRGDTSAIFWMALYQCKGISSSQSWFTAGRKGEPLLSRHCVGALSADFLNQQILNKVRDEVPFHGWIFFQ